MEEILKILPAGYQAPLWLITVALALRLLNLDKAAKVLWEELLKPYFDQRREDAARVVRGVLLEDLLYSRYMQVARHLVGEAWTVLMELREGRIAAEQVSDRLRTRSRDAIENARQALGYYRSAGGLPLSSHLENLTEERKLEFYAPIVADIVAYAADERYYAGYERIRTAVLRESDGLLKEAIGEFLKERGK